MPVRTCGWAAVFVRAFARKQAPCAGRTGFAQDSSLEGGGFQLSVPGDSQSRCSPFCAARLLGMDRRTGAGVPRFSSIIMRGKPSTMPPHTRGVLSPRGASHFANLIPRPERITGTEGSNPASSSGESTNFRFLRWLPEEPVIRPVHSHLRCSTKFYC